MKKARTLLAIWLALILTLTLFPTALAVVGQTITVQTGEGIELLSKIPSTSTTEEIIVTYKAADGYESPVCNVTVGSSTYNGVPTPNTDGSFSLTIPNDAITEPVTISLSATKSESAQPIDDGAEKETNGWTFDYIRGDTKGITEFPKDLTGQAAGTEITLPTAKRTGYFLTGWTIDDKQYSVGSVYTLPKEPAGAVKNAYPIWEEGLTITYTDGVEDLEVFKDFTECVQHNVACTVANAQTRSGYTFKGWKVGGTDQILDAGASYVPTANITMTAVWEQNVTVKYDNGSPVSYTVGETITLEKPTAQAPDGKVFTGWLSSYDNKTYQPGDKITLTETNLTLTAQYDDKVIVKFAKENNSGNVSGMPSDTEAPYNQSYKLPTKEPSRTDGSYEFGRWQLTVNGKTYTYSAGATINWASIGVKGGDTVTFIADFDHHTYPDRGDDDDRPSKPTYDEYRIRATCSDGGWVSPAGSTYVREGRNLTVTFAPYKGYAIDGVYIDGVLDNRFDGSYTFRDVDENHTIYVRYVRDSGSSGGSSGGGSHWDDDTSPKTGDASAPLSMGLGVGSLALIALLVARKMRRA